MTMIHEEGVRLSSNASHGTRRLLASCLEAIQCIDNERTPRGEEAAR